MMSSLSPFWGVMPLQTATAPTIQVPLLFAGRIGPIAQEDGLKLRAIDSLRTSCFFRVLSVVFQCFSFHFDQPCCKGLASGWMPIIEDHERRSFVSYRSRALMPSSRNMTCWYCGCSNGHVELKLASSECFRVVQYVQLCLICSVPCHWAQVAPRAHPIH